MIVDFLFYFVIDFELCGDWGVVEMVCWVVDGGVCFV